MSTPRASDETPVDAGHRATAPNLTVSGISPHASDEETAAIMAALELSWPKPAADSVAQQPSRWRFSGRWWSKPLPARRDRP